MIKSKKKALVLLTLVFALIQPIGTTPRAQAFICQSIDPFLVIFKYLEKFQEIQAWWDSLQEMKLMFDINLNISIPCPGDGSGYVETMDDLGKFGNAIPGSWLTVESTQPTMQHPIFSAIEEGSFLVSQAIDPEHLREIGNYPKEEADRLAQWIEGNATDVEKSILSLPRQVGGAAANVSGWLKDSFGSIEEGAKKMGANPMWLSENKANQVNEIIFPMPEGLYKEPGWGWLTTDKFVISMKMDGDDTAQRQAELDKSIQELYLVEQVKKKAKNGTSEYIIFLAGKPESYVLELIHLARQGNKDAINDIKEAYRSPDYAEQRIIDGNRYIEINNAIDYDLIVMARKHLRGLTNINTVSIQQERVLRSLKQKERGLTDFHQLRWDHKTTDLTAFFSNTASDQDVDLLRHSYPTLPILIYDLAFLRDNPQLRTGEFLLSNFGDPGNAVRIANILLGRTLDIDLNTVTLDPNANDEFQVNGWNYLIMNNILRDGLTRLTMAQEYFGALDNRKKFYTPEILDDSAIGDLHLLRVRSEVDLQSVKLHLLESQLRKERLLGIYMSLEMHGNSPELDYNPGL